jgi:hypothetical protein
VTLLVGGCRTREGSHTGGYLAGRCTSGATAEGSTAGGQLASWQPETRSRDTVMVRSSRWYAASRWPAEAFGRSSGAASALRNSLHEPGSFTFPLPQTSPHHRPSRPEEPCFSSAHQSVLPSDYAAQMRYAAHLPAPGPNSPRAASLRAPAAQRLRATKHRHGRRSTGRSP